MIHIVEVFGVAFKGEVQECLLQSEHFSEVEIRALLQQLGHAFIDHLSV